MPFTTTIKTEVLLNCKRYCCYCEKYKGRDIEVHHIIQEANGGKNTVDNAIPLCFDCHSEIGSYNTNHPKGNRFTKDELKQIRDSFYIKIANIPRKAISLSLFDENLLVEFKKDYTKLIEYAISTDFSSEPVNINYQENIFYLEEEKWSRKKRIFESENLENVKQEILNKFRELTYYLSDKYLRYNENNNKMIFMNQSFEESCRLKDELRPETLKIRTELNNLLQQLYMY